MRESVGERIKALRITQGMTLAELSERANISISYLSQIERDKTTPSLTSLTGIARALDVGLRYFFESDETEAAHVVLASVQDAPQPNGSISQGEPAGGRLCLSSTVADSKIQVYRVVLQPRTSAEQLDPHSGEEFGFVMAGELTVNLGDECFVLVAGDSIHYDATLPHAWSNQGDELCVVIWARSPSLIER